MREAKIHGYYDQEAMSVMIGLPELHPSQQDFYVGYAKERVAGFFAGAHSFPRLTERFQTELNDPYLLVRHDLELDCISIDRFIPQYQCYFKLTNLVDDEGRGRRLQWGEEQYLVEMFKQGDMRKTTPKELLAQKQLAASQVRTANKKRGEEQVKAAIDGLSTKQINQFVAAHRAMHTGERIVVHGADEKSLGRMAAASAKSPMVPTGRALNPGMHPLAYSRSGR